ncbi:MAG: hypothetical protein Q7S76_02030 [bacterium]|nr:hypothetical protein [bacterium]
MKKKIHRRVRKEKHPLHPKRPSEIYLLVVKTWMVVVIGALMVGIAAIIGNFLGIQQSISTPQVSGVQIEIR